MIGTFWLLFSQFTQWCFSWPSMLPEMAGMFCFTVVFCLYLSVGRNRFALTLSALAGAACAVNFALTAYVPHQIPYAWTGVFIASAWLVAHRADILIPVITLCGEWRQLHSEFHSGDGYAHADGSPATPRRPSPASLVPNIPDTVVSMAEDFG